MITFSQLGSHGRLGNQMFQYATLFSVGLTRGFKIGIPRGQKLSEVFGLQSTNYDFEVPKQAFQENGFLANPNVFLIPDNTDLIGYFQSGTYFNICADAIRNEFKFLKSIEEKADSFIKQQGNKLLCAVHVRRGDYMSLSDYHTNLGSEYYSRASDIITSNAHEKPQFLIFSDDSDWCKKAFSGDSCTVVDINNDAVELCIMSKCKTHVISNSSFSWWGAWLSKSNAVIAPKHWFGPKGPPKWDTIYEKGWVLV